MGNSYFDAYYGAYAVPNLMTHQATDASLTIMLEDTVLVERATAIHRHADVQDEFKQTGEEMKVLKKTVDVLLDESLSYKGLADVYTNAVAIVYESAADTEGVRWSIARVDSLTDLWQRLELNRKAPRNSTRNGFYLEG